MGIGDVIKTVGYWFLIIAIISIAAEVTANWINNAVVGSKTIRRVIFVVAFIFYAGLLNFTFHPFQQAPDPAPAAQIQN